jgi:hypothetical protein
MRPSTLLTYLVFLFLWHSRGGLFSGTIKPLRIRQDIKDKQRVVSKCGKRQQVMSAITVSNTVILLFTHIFYLCPSLSNIFLKVRKPVYWSLFWSWAPDGARHQDILTDRPSVAKWLWLWLRLWLKYITLWIPVHLEKLPVPQLLRNFTKFSGAQSFNTLFTRARQYYLTLAKRIQSTLSYPIPQQPISILSPNLTLGINNGHFLSHFPIRPSPHSFSLPYVLHTILTIFYEHYISWSS